MSRCDRVRGVGALCLVPLFIAGLMVGGLFAQDRSGAQFEGRRAEGEAVDDARSIPRDQWLEILPVASALPPRMQGPGGSVVAGTPPFCGAMGCEYLWDDGSPDASFGASVPSYVFASHYFVATAGCEKICGIRVAWGPISAGSPISLFVYDDPTDSEDPGASVKKVGPIAGVSASEGTGAFTDYTLPTPVNVRGGFFIGAEAFGDDTANFPFFMDETDPDSNHSWFSASFSPSPNPLPGSSSMAGFGFLGDWLIRAQAGPNQAPTAQCRPFDIEITLDEDECAAEVSPAQVDAGSFDPDGDPLTLSLNPPGPYLPGSHHVSLIVDDGAATAMCAARIEVTEDTRPTVEITILNLPPLAFDEECELDVEFQVVVTDNCCVNPMNWGLSVMPTSSDFDLHVGSPTLDTPVVVSEKQATVTGRFRVADPEECGASFSVQATARDCYGNQGGDSAFGFVSDRSPPIIGELEPIDDCYFGASNFFEDIRDAVIHAAEENCGPLEFEVVTSHFDFATCLQTATVALEDSCGQMNRSEPRDFEAKIDGMEPTVEEDPGDIAECYQTEAEAVAAAVAAVDAVTSDNCPGLEFRTSVSPGACDKSIFVTPVDACDNAAHSQSFRTLVDADAPTATCTPTQATFEVDTNCSTRVRFTGTVTDACCVDADDVTGTIGLATSNAQLAFNPAVDCVITQNGEARVDISCSATVSALTGCPAVVDFNIQATDCCGNVLNPPCLTSATVVDRIPPMITKCPEDIALPRGDLLCTDDVRNWLDSGEATDNCDPDPEITNDGGCGFPYGGTTEVHFVANDDCGNVSSSPCSAEITIGPAPRVESSKKGSLLVYPKVELRWATGPSGALLQDTILELTNDDSTRVCIQLYFVNGDPPLDPVFDPITGGVIIEGEPGWDWVDCQFCMTGDATTYWSMATGLPAGCQPFTTLDPSSGMGPGRPDPTAPGERMLRGFVYAWAVDQQGREITWNHLSGGATLVHYPNSDAWDYNAYAFQTTCEDPLQQPLDCTSFDANGVCCEAEVIPGQLGLDGFQYDPSYDVLLMQFLSSGATGLTSGSRVVTADTDLTLHPITADLRQDSIGPITTKAEFAIWNQNERRFSGTTRCITCWDQTLLSLYGNPNHFLRSNLQTDEGKARINGVRSEVCDLNCVREQPNETALDIDAILDILGVDHMCSYDASMLGVVAKHLAFSGAVTGKATAGRNLVGMGLEAGWIKADLVRLPPSALGPAKPKGERAVRERR